MWGGAANQGIHEYEKDGNTLTISEPDKTVRIELHTKTDFEFKWDPFIHDWTEYLESNIIKDEADKVATLNIIKYVTDTNPRNHLHPSTIDEPIRALWGLYWELQRKFDPVKFQKIFNTNIPGIENENLSVEVTGNNSLEFIATKDEVVVYKLKLTIMQQEGWINTPNIHFIHKDIYEITKGFYKSESGEYCAEEEHKEQLRIFFKRYKRYKDVFTVFFNAMDVVLCLKLLGEKNVKLKEFLKCLKEFIIE